MIYFCHICLNFRHFTTLVSLFDPDNTDLLSHKRCLTDSLSLSVHFVHVFHFIIRLCLSSYGWYFHHSSLNSLPQREEYCTNSTIICFCIESNLNGKNLWWLTFVFMLLLQRLGWCRGAETDTDGLLFSVIQDGCDSSWLWLSYWRRLSSGFGWCYCQHFIR